MPGNNDQPVRLADLKIACHNCSLYTLCLPIGLSRNDMDSLDTIIKRRRPLKKGEFLYRHNDDFSSVYAIRSGSVKTYLVLDDGSEQITGFHLPGELVGFDAISRNSHNTYAKALETSSICEIPFEKLEHLACKLPSLQHQLLSIMSKEIHHDEEMLSLLGKKSADQKLASLLLSLSTRHHERGFSATEFNLSMSRTDIGNYLGLAVETVSRLFTRFQEQGLLETKGKLVRLKDLEALRNMTGSCLNSPDGSCARQA